MNDLKIWLVEVIKYMEIIQQVEHLLVRNFSPHLDKQLHEIELSQLQNQILNCNITKHCATFGTPPLWVGRGLFESGLTEEQIKNEIKEAHSYLTVMLKRIEEKARSA